MTVILARKWFNKRNGNTYHTVRVLQSGERELISKVTYGYGTAYLQTAAELLLCEFDELLRSMRANHSHYFTDVVWVPAKKYLHYR